VPRQKKPTRTGSRRRSLRSDAQQNRERLLAAAREVFAESGLDAPMARVARRARVGIATLCRRFPTREALITEAFAEKMTSYAEAIDTALADPDPWSGFRGFLARVTEMQATDRGFTRALTMTCRTATVFEADRERAYAGFCELTERARRTGRLRADFVPQDLALLLMANAGVISATGDTAPDAWRRVVGYFIQAIGADHAAPLPPPPSWRDCLGPLDTARRPGAKAVRTSRASSSCRP